MCIYSNKHIVNADVLLLWGTLFYVSLWCLKIQTPNLKPWQKDWDSGMFGVCVFLPITIF